MRFSFFIYYWTKFIYSNISNLTLQEGEVSVMATEKRKLTDKQRRAIELLTCGKGMKYKDICEELQIDAKSLWNWRNLPEFSHFQEELQRVNDERWLAIVDAARESALALVKDGNAKMVEFVLKNEGYNPTTKVEADVSTDIVINIE